MLGATILLGFANDDDEPPKHVAKDVVDKIRKFRNLIHPARALKEGYDPRTFTDGKNLSRCLKP